MTELTKALTRAHRNALDELCQLTGRPHDEMLDRLAMFAMKMAGADETATRELVNQAVLNRGRRKWQSERPASR